MRTREICWTTGGTSARQFLGRGTSVFHLSLVLHLKSNRRRWTCLCKVCHVVSTASSSFRRVSVNATHIAKLTTSEMFSLACVLRQVHCHFKDIDAINRLDKYEFPGCLTVESINVSHAPCSLPGISATPYHAVFAFLLVVSFCHFPHLFCYIGLIFLTLHLDRNGWMIVRYPLH